MKVKKKEEKNTSRNHLNLYCLSTPLPEDMCMALRNKREKTKKNTTHAWFGGILWGLLKVWQLVAVHAGKFFKERTLNDQYWQQIATKTTHAQNKLEIAMLCPVIFLYRKYDVVFVNLVFVSSKQKYVLFVFSEIFV